LKNRRRNQPLSQQPNPSGNLSASQPSPLEELFSITSFKGIRTWMPTVVDGRPVLRSLYRSIFWPADDALHALCLRDTGNWMFLPPPQIKEEHTAPDERCQCGIYAVASDVDALNVLPDGAAVMGIVEAWGTVIEGTKGFRAEYARPIALFRRIWCWPKDRDRVARLTRAIVKRYGLDLLPWPPDPALTAEAT
jgi:hypothetical protein